MMLFWILVALFAAVALAFVLPTLLRRGNPVEGVAVDATNVAVHRDQLRELEADLAAGTLKREQYDEARREIERRLLDDVGSEGAAPRPAEAGLGAAIVVALALPLSAILLYLAVGNPAALTGAAAVAARTDAHGVTREQIEGMVERFAARMKETPDDVKGWVMLARSYTVLDRFQEAAAAYANAVKRSPPDAQLLADYADSLAMAQGRNLMGEPERLIAQALTIDPANVKALALAGTVAFEKRDFKGAVVHWEKLLSVVPAESEMAGSVRKSIAEARSHAGLKPGAEPAPPRRVAATPAPGQVSGTVRLAPALAARTAPTDSVFIFARAASGPRMPLAVMRKQVRDLPASFTLDDSMAMTPAAKISNHAEIVVGARVSKRGGPTPEPGDLEGLSAPLKAGATGVVVVIDREIPAK